MAEARYLLIHWALILTEVWGGTLAIDSGPLISMTGEVGD